MAALTTGGVRKVWGPACDFTHATVTLYGGARITVDVRTVAAFKALSAVLERHAYPARAVNEQTGKPVTGAYNCRAITGGTLPSLHSYGVAVDINWDRNGYGPKLVTDMPPAMVAEILMLRTNSGAQVFRWGGTYAGNKDAMHYEIVCTPAELATGIKADAPPLIVVPPIITVTDREDDDVANPNSRKSADGRVELFYISPVGDLYHAYQDPVAGAALGPLAPFGQPEGVKLDPAQGVRIEANTDERLEIFCGKLDAAGGVLQSNQTAPSGGWTPLVQLP